MTASRLPINLNDLLAHRTVESDRIEYKAGWNPTPIIRTLCAFANDFENLGGGYVVIGFKPMMASRLSRPLAFPPGNSTESNGNCSSTAISSNRHTSPK